MTFALLHPLGFERLDAADQAAYRKTPAKMFIAIDCDDDGDNCIIVRGPDCEAIAELICRSVNAQLNHGAK